MAHILAGCLWVSTTLSGLVRFHMAEYSDQLYSLCLQDRLEKLERVYLVCSGTLPGAGVPYVFEPAHISLRGMLEHLDWAR